MNGKPPPDDYGLGEAALVKSRFKSAVGGRL